MEIKPKKLVKANRGSLNEFLIFLHSALEFDHRLIVHIKWVKMKLNAILPLVYHVIINRKNLDPLI